MRVKQWSDFDLIKDIANAFYQVRIWPTLIFIFSGGMQLCAVLVPNISRKYPLSSYVNVNVFFLIIIKTNAHSAHYYY